jgi:hypothetical protein
MTNQNTKWSCSDRVKMFKLAREGVPVELIAEVLNRTGYGVMSQLNNVYWNGHALPSNTTYNTMRDQIICATLAGLLTIEDISDEVSY